MSRATLYVIPGSHPSRAAELMLRHKGLDYKRRDLITSLHKPILRARGFPHATVPAVSSSVHHWTTAESLVTC